MSFWNVRLGNFEPEPYLQRAQKSLAKLRLIPPTVSVLKKVWEEILSSAKVWFTRFRSSWTWTRRSPRFRSRPRRPRQRSATGWPRVSAGWQFFRQNCSYHACFAKHPLIFKTMGWCTSYLRRRQRFQKPRCVTRATLWLTCSKLETMNTTSLVLQG